MKYLKQGLILLIFQTTLLNISQSQEWAWLKNRTDLYMPGVYTSIGNVNSTNTPGARRDGILWYANNSVYLFGGNGFDGLANEGVLNDTWQYNPQTNNWVWIKGSSTRNDLGNFGTVTIENVNNTPSARDGFISWEYMGEFYLFGGSGLDAQGKVGYLSDIWKFNPATNNWTWIGGSDQINRLPIYGTQGLADINNTPGGRSVATGWINGNKVYLFGGAGPQSEIEGTSMNGRGDLWEYDLSTKLWTWIKGSDQPFPSTFHLQSGVESQLNEPGFIRSSVSTVISGQLYLFGGLKFSGYSNQTWKFNPATGMWTFMKGDDNTNILAQYGQLGVANSQNNPGSLAFTKGWVIDNEMYFFGGYGSNETTEGRLRDVWKYSGNSNTWTWVWGDKLADGSSHYGGQGNYNEHNMPSGRFGASIVKDSQNGLYVFGGEAVNDQGGTGVSYDLWRLSLTNQTTSSLIQNFKAKKIRDDDVELTWDVISSSGISQFVVEHSLDSTNFAQVGTVTATSNTSYSFIHTTPTFQKNYYRLKVINQDNSISYSGILVINMGNSSFVKIFSNPVANTLQFSCDNISGNSRVQVINSNGVLFIDQSMNINSNLKSLNVSNLNPGAYFLVVTLRDVVASAQFIKY
ncbi:MAG TPA: kelch repeat-containing protein [Chitinophagaceae bacterium]|nr:kelch repeat-containing protein [Chitinophagaceae bacterium]